MTIVEPAVGPLEEILTALDPDLNRGPQFMPTPDPPIHIGILGKRLDWSDVFTAAVQKVRDVLPHGTNITNASTVDVQNAAEAALGQSIAAVGGFVEQTASAVVHLASLVDATVVNIQSNMLNDFRTNSERLDKLQAHNDFIDQYVVPNLQAQIVHAEAFAYATALAAQQNAERYSRETIFTPLYTELLKVQPAIDRSIKTNNPTILEAAQSKVNALHDLLIPTLTALASGLGKVETEVTDCVKPMCDTMGPKTDLGKLLKGLSLVASAAAIADLLSLTEPELVQRLTDTIGEFARFIGTIEHDFLQGGRTIGATIAGL